MSYHTNYNLTSIHTPIKVTEYERLLRLSHYPEDEIDFLIKGFTGGFDVDYRGRQKRQDLSNNLPFFIGDKFILWEKIMTEVKNLRYVGPYDSIPYDYYVQSLVGLVPKSNGQTRLIFHLSFDFKEFRSINYYTPKELCTVKYRDLDHAIKSCLSLMKRYPNCDIWMGISDMKSAFRVVPTRKNFWNLFIIKAKDPNTGKTKYFLDKNLAFRARISCALFQRFSNSIAHIFNYFSNQERPIWRITNYLDDFYFVNITEESCNDMVRRFIHICERIGAPIAYDKMNWGTKRLQFLGIVIDGEHKILIVPQDKRIRAVNMLNYFLCRKKATVRLIQSLAGLLNFINRVVHPGRVFTQRMYAKMGDKTERLMPHHHVNLDMEFRQDCKTWLMFLEKENINHLFCRPLIDFSDVRIAKELNFYTDSSANWLLGFGGIFEDEYFFHRWESNYIQKFNPCIEYLELYGVCMGLYIWEEKLRNSRIIIHCDNLSVCNMLENITSGCPNCMKLIRMVVLHGLEFNTRVFMNHVRGVDNGQSDSLSRLKIQKFFNLAPENMKRTPQPLHPALWPASKIW